MLLISSNGRYLLLQSYTQPIISQKYGHRHAVTRKTNAYSKKPAMNMLMAGLIILLLNS
jgi:hypothetical protein